MSGYSDKDLQEILGNRVESCGSQYSVETPEIEAVKDDTEVLGDVSGVELVEGTVKDNAVLESACTMSHTEITCGHQSTEWWGHKHGFIWGGLLGAKSQAKRHTTAKENQCTAAGNAQVSGTRTAFREEDQENLYKLVQDKATTGKQGLGIGDRPKKISGAHWKGHKVSFDTDDDNEGGSGDEKDLKEAFIHSGSLKRKMDVDTMENTGTVHEEKKLDAVNITDASAEPKLKWKTLCKQLIQEAPGQSMKIKRLKKCVQMHSSSFFSMFSSNDDAALYLTKKLENSSRFIVQGKRVTLSNSN